MTFRDRRSFLVAGLSCLSLASAAMAAPLPSDSINPMDFGANGDGIAEDSAALRAADHAASAAGLPLRLTRRHKIAASYTLTSSLLFEGGRLEPAAGVVLTLGPGLTAPPVQLFAGAGSIAFSTPPAAGHPEWWGARSTVDSFDSHAAIMACIAACQVVQFQRGDYYVSQRVIVSQGSRQLLGSFGVYDGTPGSATRLIGLFNDRPVLRLGPDERPRHINDYPAGITLRGLWVQFNRPPDIGKPLPVIDVGTIRNSDLSDLWAYDGIYGYQFGGAVDVHVLRCRSQRTGSGQGKGTDRHIGFYINGGAEIGLAGGNASLHIEKCTAIGTHAFPDCSGLVADQYFTDLWVEHFETSACAQPLAINGQFLGRGEKDTFGNTDCLIEHPVLDGYETNAIRIWNVNRSGSVEVSKPYCAPAAGVSTPAISFRGNEGIVNLTGGQLVMGPGKGAGGVEIVDCHGGGCVSETQILESSGAAVRIANTDGFEIRPHTLNAVKTLAAAVRMEGHSTRNLVAPFTRGAKGKVAAGITVVGDGNSYNEFNGTGVDSSLLPSASAKLTINGTAITTAGAAGLNTVSGNML
ncbi:hypothetical protein [Novosphingobium terrae]|uniref:hypothetical protein n=1 Tax=Novosphingobium terrae TaxID=2726189 RepID=UPI001981FB9F|nr:hypothetical protein [Novosphingobium terrae]